jgi:hypothetical protein
MSDLNYQLELANHFILETGMNVFFDRESRDREDYISEKLKTQNHPNG